MYVVGGEGSSLPSGEKDANNLSPLKINLDCLKVTIICGYKFSELDKKMNPQTIMFAVCDVTYMCIN